MVFCCFCFLWQSRKHNLVQFLFSQTAFGFQRFLFLPFFQRAFATAPFLCAPMDDVYQRRVSVTRKMTAGTAQMRKTAMLMSASIDVSVAVLKTARTYWLDTRSVKCLSWSHDIRFTKTVQAQKRKINCIILNCLLNQHVLDKQVKHLLYVIYMMMSLKGSLLAVKSLWICVLTENCFSFLLSYLKISYKQSIGFC